MHRKFLHSKIHRAVVTHADLQYEGSLTLPIELLEAADIREFESVQVWNVTQGTRLETYAIRGQAGNRDICANGAAAHLIAPGDIIIIATFKYLTEEEAQTAVEPIVVFVNASNQIVELDQQELAGPARRER